MCCHRHSGLGLIVLGALIFIGGAVCHFHGQAHREAFERHVAEICVQAAEQVHK